MGTLPESSVSPVFRLISLLQLTAVWVSSPEQKTNKLQELRVLYFPRVRRQLRFCVGSHGFVTFLRGNKMKNLVFSEMTKSAEALFPSSE